MKHTLIILLLLTTTLCYGQGYKVCKVYFENNKDSRGNGLYSEEHYNKYGKTTYYKLYGENKHDSIESYTSLSDTTKYQSAEYTNYNYRDSFLISSVSYSFNSYRDQDKKADTSKQFYYYDSKGLLIEERYTEYTKHTHGSCIPDRERTWGDTIINYYKYDNRVNKILDSFGSRKSTNPEYLNLDEGGNVGHIVDSTMHAEKGTKHIVPVTRYVFDDKNRLILEIKEEEEWTAKYEYIYRKDTTFTITIGENPDTTITTYVYDKYGRILEEAKILRTLEYNTVFTLKYYYAYRPEKKLIKTTQNKVYLNPEDNDKGCIKTFLYTYE